MKKHGLFAKTLGIILAFALVFTALPLGVFAADGKPQELLLATLSDIHYYPATLAGNRGEGFYTYVDGALCIYEDIDAIIDAALASLELAAKERGLKYVVIPGDLTLNGEYEGHVELAKKLAAFKEKSGLEIFVINGNHDLNNSDGTSFVNDSREPAKVTTASEFAAIYADFGFNQAYHTYKETADDTQGCLTYSIKLDEGYRLIMIDAGKYSRDATESGVDEHETAGAMTEEQIKWVENEAADAVANGETPLAFSHWNISGMNYFHETLLQGFVIDDGYILQERLADAGIHYFFSGHQHASDIDVTYSDSGEPMYSIITPTLTEFPFSYRMTAFDYDENGTLNAHFEQLSCGEGVGVDRADGNGKYAEPYYMTAGFEKEYSASTNGAGFLIKLVHSIVDKYAGEIRKEGSVVSFIEKHFGLDIEALVNKYLHGGIKFDGKVLFSGANVMSFLDDIDVQLMNRYIYDLDYTYSVLDNAIVKIVNEPISDVPCEKFISDYGFGSAEKGSTVGDLLLSMLVYMYTGNEDISDDLFMQDIISRLENDSTEIPDRIFEIALEDVVKDVVVDEILANINLNWNTFFFGESRDTMSYVQLFYRLLVQFLGSGILTSTDLKSFGDGLLKLVTFGKSSSLKALVEAVLGTGLIKYGKNIDELLDNLLNMFLGENQRKAAANQCLTLIGGMLIDEDPDHGVTYSYSGPVEVTPSAEDMQLPCETVLTICDGGCGFNATWFTKYSVTGTDIELTLDGNKVEGAQITAASEESTYDGYGFDFGTFGILPYAKKVIRHSVTVTGLERGKKYDFVFGDTEKGFMSAGSFTTAPENDEDPFTFIYVADSSACTPGGYAVLGDTLSSAEKMFPDAAFIVHTGNLTLAPGTDDQWLWAAQASEDILLSTPLMYCSGALDAAGVEAMTKHFTFENLPDQFADTGVYYSYDYGEAHFIFLNTNDLDGGVLGAKQTKWLREDLESSGAVWNILVLNRGIFTGNEENDELRAQLVTLMDQFKIDVILQGSEKAYIRSKLIVGGEENPYYETDIKEIGGRTYLTYLDSNGTTAVSSGAAVSDFAETAPESDLFMKSVTLDSPVYCAVTVSGDSLAFDTYTAGTDERVDSFAISKSKISILRGDTDLDGAVTAADARAALRYSVGLETLSPKARAAADVDEDCIINAGDARIILRHSVGLTPFEDDYVRKTEYQLEHLGF